MTRLTILVLCLIVTVSAQSPPIPAEIDAAPFPALAVGIAPTITGAAYQPVIFIEAGVSAVPVNAVHVADFVARKIGCSGKGSACDYPVQVWKIQ